MPSDGAHCCLFGIILLLWFYPTKRTPIATPTAIQTGSLVAAKTAAIAVPTPIQFPTLLEFLDFLFILHRNLRSLHRHTFSEIPRLIDISASGNRDMISEKLERDRKHDWPC